MISQRLKENLDQYSFNINIKDNIDQNDKSKNQSMLFKAIQILKVEKQSIIRQKENELRNFQKQKAQLKNQIQYYKRKLAEMSQTTILQTLLKENEPSFIKKKKEDQYLQNKKLQIEVDHLRALLKEKDQAVTKLEQKNREIQEKIKVAIKEKQKNMEISLMEKISQDERRELLEKDVAGKKRIIESMKRQIQGVSILEKNLLKQQKQVSRKAKELKKIEEQLQSFFNHNQKSLQNKIQALTNENNFLRKQIKKVLKQVKSSCKCEGQAEEWKQKLFKIGKQLAHARVQLSKNNFLKQRKQKQKSPIDSSKCSDSSLESLELSDDGKNSEDL